MGGLGSGVPSGGFGGLLANGGGGGSGVNLAGLGCGGGPLPAWALASAQQQADGQPPDFMGASAVRRSVQFAFCLCRFLGVEGMLPRFCSWLEFETGFLMC